MFFCVIYITVFVINLITLIKFKMEETQIIIRTKKILLIGLTGAGKSRLGNFLSGAKIFKESDGPDSCTKGTEGIINHFIVEVIDSQGLEDTDNEDKEVLTSIFNCIKNKRPNIIALVANCANKRFGNSCKKIIKEICKMFDTKSVWNHFIIVFTVANSVSPKKRDDFAQNYINSIIKVLDEYYKKNKVNDNLPIPEKLQTYFVELGNDDDYKLNQETINNLTDINKQIYLLPSLDNIKEKIIVDIIHKRNCQESIKKYNRIIVDEYGTLKRVGANIGGCIINFGIGALGGTAIIGTCGLGTGVVVPALVTLGSVVGISATGIGVSSAINNIDYEHCVDDKTQNEDYITFDEDTYIYHDGTKEVKKINVQEFTRIIEKKNK